MTNCCLARSAIYFLAIGVCGLGLASAPETARGQEAPTSPDNSATSAPGLDEVVVSARRRDERLQDVPQAVTAMSAAQLTDAGVTSTTQLSQMVPSLNLPHSGSNLQPTIRGIGTTNSSEGDEPNVAIYIDDVYQPDAISNTFQLASIQRIEVLNGPQGTLYGRNATAGAIKIITRDPSPQFQANVSLGYGSFGERTGSAYVTGALSDRVNADIALNYDQDDGYIYNIFRQHTEGGQTSLIVRPKFVIAVDDTSSVTVGLHYSYLSDPTGQLYQPLNGNVSYRHLPAGAGLPIPTAAWTDALNLSPVNDINQYEAFVKYATTMKYFDFSSQTSTTADYQHNVLDPDYGPLSLAYSQPYTASQSYQQEFLLSSLADSPVTWVGGLFAYRYEAKYDPRLAGSSANGITPFTFTRVDSQETTTSLAPFGEGTLNFFTHWALTAGFRYTYEHKEASGSTNSGPEISASHTWGNFSPRVILEYKIPQVANLYASYSEGFKSGLYKIDSLSSPLNRVDPETLDAYEVGIKSAASERWRVNLAAFYYDYNNIQISAFSFPSIFLLNAAKGKAEGFESQFDATVTADLRANAFVSYTHTDYTSFPNAIIDVPTGIGGNEQINGVNESGQPFLRAPQWLAGAGLAYKHSFASGVVGADADYSYNGGFNWEITGRVREPHYGLLNANLSWSPPKEDYTVTVWGTNLTNQPYEISGNASTIGDNIVFGRPRSIGVKVGFKFN